MPSLMMIPSARTSGAKIAKTATSSTVTSAEATTAVAKICKSTDPEVAILELAPFGLQPIVNFGQVPLEQTQIKYVAVRNLSDTQQQLFVKSFPKPDKGFNIDATEFLLTPRTEKFIALAWTPKVSGSFRETITLQAVSRLNRRIVMIGTAVRPKPEPTQKSVKSTSVSRFGLASRTSIRRCSPSKTVRPVRPERFHALFRAPAATAKTSSVTSITISKSSDQPTQKPLTKLIYASRQRQSGQIVKKILAKQEIEKQKIQEQVAIKIQSYWRMVCAKRELIHIKETRAAICIQKHWKGFVARRELARLKELQRIIVLFQCNCRGFIMRIRTRKALEEVRRQKVREQAALKIQSYWRVVCAKRELIHIKETRAAICIQKHWKGFVARRELARLKELQRIIVLFQCNCRGFIMRIRTRKALEEVRRQKAREQAALKIQSYWRMVCAKRKLIYLEETRAAICIQKHWRTSVARRELAQLKELQRITLLLQCHCRGFIERARIRKSIEALYRCQTRSIGQRCHPVH